MPLLLSEADVRSVLSMSDLVETMTGALAEFSTGAAQQPLRTVIQVGEHKSFFGVMPAHLEGSGAMGTKLVTVFAGNAARGLPTHLATIVLLDPATGALRAVLDGRYITEARTAAVSAVSARLLARGDADVLAILGSGVQARSYLAAMAHVRTLREVRVWSPDPAHRRSFVDEHSATAPCPVIEAASAREAVAGSTLVVLVSASPDPVVCEQWISAGTHICAVGACRPDHREMDTALVGRGRLFVDSRRGALAEAGDVLIPIAEGAIVPDHIAGELGELAAGRVAGRQSPEQVTIFKSLGMAVEDISAAHLAWQRAVARGIGHEI